MENNTVIGDRNRIAGVSLFPLSISIIAVLMLFGQQREVGCQKIKCRIRFGLHLQGDCLWVECQGGGAHGRQQSMAVTHSCSTEGRDSPGSGWHFSRLPAAVMGSQ